MEGRKMVKYEKRSERNIRLSMREMNKGTWEQWEKWLSINSRGKRVEWNQSRVKEGKMVKYGKESKREESKEWNVEKWLNMRSEGDMRIMRKWKND